MTGMEDIRQKAVEAVAAQIRDTMDRLAQTGVDRRIVVAVMAEAMQLALAGEVMLLRANDG